MIFSLFLSALSASAQTYVLTNGNSSVSIAPASSSGVDNWTVDNQNQLANEWFYYRIGNSGTASSIDTIGAPVVSQPNAQTLVTTYASSQFSLQVVYSLLGGAPGSGTSDLGEQIKIQNLTSSPLSFTFFQYSDFELGGAFNQTAQLGRNSRGQYNEALVTSGSVSIAENIDSAISPGGNFGETALGGSTLQNIRNTPGYNLNDNMTAGPGAATWALEWTNSIAANGAMLISKDLNISGVSLAPVPEPSALSVMAAGLAGLGIVKRYLRRRS